MININAVCVGVAVALCLILIIAIGMYADWKDYNKGRCKKCGKKMILFDYDSGGSRGYRCPDWHDTVWVSCVFVDKGGGVE